MQPALSIKQEQARRAAQSRKDKARAKQGGPGRSAAPRMIQIQRKEPGSGSSPAKQDRMVPLAKGRFRGINKPDIQSSSGRGGDLRIRVKHREYVQDILGTAAYALVQLNINPGLAQLFPWLSGIAALFESYKFNRLKFCYESQTNATVSGKAYFSADWDVTDVAPVNKQQQMQERSKASDMIFEDFCLMCDKNDLEKFGIQRYVRVGNAPAGTDLKTYDVGVFNQATQNCAVTTAVGELWVEYDLELITPNPSQNGGALSAKITAGGTVSNAAVLGTAPVIVGSLPVTVDPTGEIITINAVGQYLFELYVTGTLSALTITAGGAANTGNVYTALNSFVSNGSFAVISARLEVMVPGATFTFSAPTGTVTAAVVRLAPYTYINA